MNKKKLLFAIWSLGIGGAERSLVNLLTKVDPDIYDIDLLLFENGGQLKGELPSHINILSPSEEALFLNNNKIREMLMHFSLKCFIYRLIYILFHRNRERSSYNKDQLLWKQVWKKCVPKIAGSYDTAVGYMHSIPSYYVMDKVNASCKILWVHHDYSKLNSDIEFDYEYFNRADFVVTVSEICLNKLQESFTELNKKLLVLQNISSCKLIYKLAGKFIPEEYNYPVKNNIPVLLSIGRLHEVKGFDMAIDAALLLLKDGYEYRWFIIGEGELMEKLQKQINNNGLENRVFLLGGKPNPYPYLKGADIIVQTSRNEGKSMVIDEAKILCKPISATAYDSAGDQITDGITGLLTEISPDGIYRGVKKLLEDKEMQQRLIHNLQSQNYDTTGELEKYYEIF